MSTRLSNNVTHFDNNDDNIVKIIKRRNQTTLHLWKINYIPTLNRPLMTPLRFSCVRLGLYSRKNHFRLGGQTFHTFIIMRIKKTVHFATLFLTSVCNEISFWKVHSTFIIKMLKIGHNGNIHEGVNEWWVAGYNNNGHHMWTFSTYIYIFMLYV